MKQYDNLDDERVDWIFCTVIASVIVIGFLFILLLFTGMCLIWDN